MPLNSSHINTFKYNDEDGKYHNITCSGREVMEPKMTPIYATLGDSYEKVRTDLKMHHKQYSGPMTISEYYHLLDLINAEKVYYMKGASMILITVLDFDLGQELPRNKQIEGWFEWIVANENSIDV